MTFELESLRFSFLARDAIHFPALMPANILRGACGVLLRKTACRCAAAGPHSPDCRYARLFEPQGATIGPSGLRDSPRPFVFRARHLDGRTVEPGEPFYFDMNVFETRASARELLQAAFAQCADEGLGPTRGRADLMRVNQQKLSLNLEPPSQAATEIAVDFLTPTELKGGEGLIMRPEFPVLLARIRDRVSTLRSLYGTGPLDIDFAALVTRATAVSLHRCEIKEAGTSRHSSRTGRSHPLAGFTGVAGYQGPLSEFVPLLEAAQWTGVGRQTVWGKGEIAVRVL